MFVAMAGILYVALAILGLFAFNWSLNYLTDQQLRVLASDFGHAIELNGAIPQFRDWIRVVQTKPARSLVAIQLFSPDGNLLEHYGPTGPSTLINGANQPSNFRTVVSPLTKNLSTLGFLQISIPTAYRDEAIRTLEITAVFLAPSLLLGLGVIGYFVSDAATLPIRETLEMLRRFIADASHELNTPLSTLKARAEMMAKNNLEPKLKKDLQIIDAAISRMEKIVEDLMLLAEIEGTREKPNDETTRIDQAVIRIFAEFKPKFVNKNIQFELSVVETELKAYISSHSFERVVANLVENAFRYTEAGGNVKVSLLREGSFVKIDVIDSGIGIPPDKLPYIFDRFYRVENSRSRQSGGSGLGLAIVKALVDSHNGRISVSSEVGKGSIFTVFLKAKT
jgi:signal transduction histidine kinase